ncbi:MAG: extracellular solute-binding protein [Parvibaculaceae bacterium]|nr:extracellular solute-binding protein [Parvibaculaceae bacterium]
MSWISKRMLSKLAGVALATLLPTAAFAADAGELNIYNWTDYTSPDLIAKFEKETGVKVKVDTYDSNETLLAKLKSGGGGYDIVVVSSDFVPIFVKEGLVQEVDASTMPSFKNLDPKWQKREWDVDAKYTVPWVWGTTSYSVDTAVYKGPTDTLKSLFEPDASMKGKIGMFGSPTEVISLALVYLNKPQCNTNPADLKQLNALLEAQKPFVKVYNSDGIIERMGSGETSMHEQWSGGALRARWARSTVKYVYPKEGAIGWMDNIAVPTGAKNVENAKKFFDFMMRPENVALQSTFSGYQNAVTGSEKFLEDKLAKAPEFNPPADLKITFAPSCSPKAIKAYDLIWTKLRQ